MPQFLQPAGVNATHWEQGIQGPIFFQIYQRGEKRSEMANRVAIWSLLNIESGSNASSPLFCLDQAGPNLQVVSLSLDMTSLRYHNTFIDVDEVDNSTSVQRTSSAPPVTLDFKVWDIKLLLNYYCTPIDRYRPRAQAKGMAWMAILSVLL